MKKDLQDFYSFLSEELKCENNGVYEIKEKKGSTFRHIVIKKYGNFFVLKQKDEFKAGLFKDAISSCDFIEGCCIRRLEDIIRKRIVCSMFVTDIFFYTSFVNMLYGDC